MKPYWEGGGVVLYHGDCREVAPVLREKGVIITDPPYSKHVHQKSRAGARKLGGNAAHGTARCRSNTSRARDFGFEHLSPSLRRFVAIQAARLAERWVLVFSDVESCAWWRISMQAAGLDYVRTGAWEKLCGTPQFTGERPGVGFEAITIMHPRGRKRWNGGGSPALWSAAVVLGGGQTAGQVRSNEAQKPELLISALVRHFSEPGELIYDFFAGSCTLGVCSIRARRRAVLIEQREEQCEAGARRLERELARGYQAEMFAS